MKLAVKIFLLASLLSAQATGQEFKIVSTAESKTSLLDINTVKDISIIKTGESFMDASLEKAFYDFQNSVKKGRSKNILPQLDIVSSFRSNIRFGGFWEKYTIINFTPELFIKPADFISIYAIRNISCFVPLDGIRQNIRSMVLRSAAIMAVDNSVRMFFSAGGIAGPIAGFLVKNFLIHIINMVEEKRDAGNRLLRYDYNYYSVSIRF